MRVSVGAVGVALRGDDGRVARTCHRFPTAANFFCRLSGLSALSGVFRDGAMREWAHDSDRRVDHVIGAFYMVRAADFGAVGGFDERFFVYLEDLDLSPRPKARGLACQFFASVDSYHKGGGSSERVKASRLMHSTRSRVLHAFKHFGPAQAWLHLVATCLIEPPARLAGCLLRRRPGDVGDMVAGFGMFFRELGATIRLAVRR